MNAAIDTLSPVSTSGLNNAEIRKVRRQIARINTYIRQREIAAAEAGN